ncbi:MAG: octaprenyl diphosphate synthase, partial [bacterium]
GDDLAEGKPTLPLIHALRHGAPAQRETIRSAIASGGRDRIGEILRIVESTGALAYTAARAQRHSQDAIAALARLDASPYKDALIHLAEFAVRRGH